MTVPATLAAAPKHKPNQNAAGGRTNLPDPRPVTEYTASYSEVSGHSRVTITLAQPCVVRLPKWTLIDSEDGSEVTPASSVVVSNTTFYMDFAGLIPKSACFVNPPYQDMEVQNFQGGFVRPGGQWFSVK